MTSRPPARSRVVPPRAAGEPSEGSDGSKSAVAGIVTAAVLVPLLLGCVLVGCCCYRRRQQQREMNKEPGGGVERGAAGGAAVAGTNGVEDFMSQGQHFLGGRIHHRCRVHRLESTPKRRWNRNRKLVSGCPVMMEAGEQHRNSNEGHNEIEKGTFNKNRSTPCENVNMLQESEETDLTRHSDEPKLSASIGCLIVYALHTA